MNLLITISQSSEFFLTGGIPNVESDWAVVGVEDHWVHFDSESSDVLLLELSSQMSLDEGSLSDTTITDKHEFVFSNDLLLLLFHFL